MKSHAIAIAMLLGSVYVLSGCAAGGAAFVPAVAPPEGKALVYIYRPDSIVGGAIRYHVAEGDKRIVYLIRGGYFPYLADPGEREFWARTESKATATETLKAGHTYYLQGRIGAGLGVGRPRLTFVSEETGKKEVAKCKLLPAAEGSH